jgi:hypothetical protein
MNRKNSLLMMARKGKWRGAPFILQPSVNLFFFSFSAAPGYTFHPGWI